MRFAAKIRRSESKEPGQLLAAWGPQGCSRGRRCQSPPGAPKESCCRGTFVSAEHHGLLRGDRNFWHHQEPPLQLGSCEHHAWLPEIRELPFTLQAPCSSGHWLLNEGTAITRAMKMQSQVPKHDAGWLHALVGHHGPSPACPSRGHFWPPGMKSHITEQT